MTNNFSDAGNKQIGNSGTAILCFVRRKEDPGTGADGSEVSSPYPLIPFIFMSPSSQDWLS